jgi:site-specific DNA-methyltransferase (adenine-specific)
VNRLRVGQGELWLGDCLDVLSKLREKFDLVYVDPPFNAGGERGARAGAGARARGRKAYADSWGGIDGFLSMLKPRLAAIRAAMSERGSLWLHLDHRGVHEAKCAADAVFGRVAFQGEVIWVPGNGARRRNGPSVTHQTILIYSKGPSMLWNEADPSLREPYAETSRRMHFTQKDAEGRLYRERVIGGKAYRYYADRGRKLGSVWTDCGAMRANTPLIDETTGYPTQKPEALLERIVRAASTEGSVVLDPMCGSGTTLAVARRLGRRFCGIDQSPVAFETSAQRLARAEAQGLKSAEAQAKRSSRARRGSKAFPGSPPARREPRSRSA